MILRSSLPEVICKKGALKNSAKLTGKHLRQSLFFKKVTGNTYGQLLLSRQILNNLII